MPIKKPTKKDDKPKMTRQEKSKLFKLCKRKRLNAAERKSLIEQPDIVNGQGENLLHNYCKHEGMDFSLITDMVNNGHTFDNYNKHSGYGPLISCLSFCDSDKVYEKIYHMISVGCPICKDGFDFTEFFFIDLIFTPGTCYSSFYLEVGKPKFFNFVKYLYEEGIFETNLTKEKYRFIKPTNYFEDEREIKWFDEHFNVDWDLIDINAKFGLKKNIHAKDFDGKPKRIQNPLYQYIYSSVPTSAYYGYERKCSIDEVLEMIEFILEKQHRMHYLYNYYYEFLDRYINYECSDGKLLDLILIRFHGDKILLRIRTCLNRLLWGGTDKNYNIDINFTNTYKNIFLDYTNKIYKGLTSECTDRRRNRNINNNIMENYSEYGALQVKKNIIFTLIYGYLTDLPLELIRILGITYDEVVNPDKITEPFIVNNGQQLLTSDEYALIFNIYRYVDMNNTYTFPEDDEIKAKIRKQYIDANPGIKKFTRKYCEEELKKIVAYSKNLRENELKELKEKREKDEIKSKGKVSKSTE